MNRTPNPKLTGLNDGPKTLVYRAVVAQLMKDQTLAPLFRPTSWFTWEGKPSDAAEISLSMMPAIRITPAARDPQWNDPTSQKGDMTFDLELWTQGTCCDDIANLWDAVEQAIYSSSDYPTARAFEQSLVALGAITGIVSVMMCAMMPWSPDREGNVVLGMYARGQLGVSVRINS